MRRPELLLPPFMPASLYNLVEWDCGASQASGRQSFTSGTKQSVLIGASVHSPSIGTNIERLY